MRKLKSQGGSHSGHGHHHAHGERDFGEGTSVDYARAFKLGIVINTLFVAIEAGCGLWVGSVALVSDAGHNLTDVLALGLAWGAFAIARKPPTSRHTYGLKRATILASLASAVMLCIALGAIGWEAITRLSSPPPMNGVVLVVVAGVGVIINAITAAMFMRGRHIDLNLRGAYLHMAADAAVSFAVVLAGALIYWTGWLWVDPVLALLVAVTIGAAGYNLLRESLDLAMDAVPSHVDVEAVRHYLASLPGVADVHDLHIWGMSTTETALTAHLVVDSTVDNDDRLRRIADHLGAEFRIKHPTIQLERGLSEQGCVYPDRLLQASNSP